MKTRNIPIIVGGGLDTKTNPKLVKPGSALQLVNMRQARTGELSVRNGFTSLPVTFGAAARSDLYAGLSGGLLSIPPATNIPMSYAGGAVQSWVNAAFGLGAANLGDLYPRMTARNWPWAAAPAPFQSTDMTDPDFAVSANLMGMSAAAMNGAIAENPLCLVRSAVDGPVVGRIGYNTPFGTVARPSIMVTGGINNANPTSQYLCQVRVDTTTTPYSIWVDNLTNIVGTGGTSAVSTKIVNADLSTAQPWVDAKALNSGAGTLTTRFAVVYRATGGGVTVLTFDPATNAIFGGPNNFPAVGASMALGILDDAAFPQAPTLRVALANAADGVTTVRFDCTSSTITLGSQTTIDATVTSGVRQITGYSTSSGSNVAVLWDTDATPTYAQTIHYGTWNGTTATSVLLTAGPGLYSRAFRASDGNYYVIGSYDSTAFPAYVVQQAKSQSDGRGVAGMLLPGYAGGRRAAQSSLASVATSNGAYLVPLMQKTAVTVPGAPANRRVITVASLSLTTPLRRPRELGGTLFLPGGLVMKHDGATMNSAVFPVPPESPTVTPQNGGSLTALGTYFYRIVYKKTDATGRITRSAGSVPVSATLTGIQSAVGVTVAAIGLDDDVIVEYYRAGPASAGATQYNKVRETPAANAVGTWVDQTTDAAAGLGELLYSSGNVLENTTPPSCNLLEVNAQRVWIVNAEDPTQLWFSKEYAAGTGVGFNSNNVLSVTGDGRGPITALAAMDGHIIAFKDAAIWVISGQGPNNLGQGSFNPPQAVSLTVGCNNPSSVVQTPDGVIFQGAKGMWLLDRGLSLQYIGAPVESFTSAAQVVDASLVLGYPEARFVFASGTCIVYDYFQKCWYTYTLRTGGSSIVACADSSLYGWCYATADGVVRQEVAGALTDDGNAIIPAVSLPHLNFAGLSGYQRLYSLDLLLDVVGNHTISVDAEFNYSGAVTGTPKTKALTTATPTAQVQYLPPDGFAKCTAMRPVITVSGSPVSGVFRLTVMTACVGIKSGTNIADTSRLT